MARPKERQDDEHGDEPRRYAIHSVDRALDLLEAILEKGPQRLSDLSTVLEVTKSTAFRHAANLEERGYVSAHSDGSYGPGPQLFKLAKLAIAPWERLIEATRPERLRLRDALNETVNLGSLHNARVLFLEVLSSKYALRMVPEAGAGGYVHSTALGKSILAHLSEDEVTEILEAAGMPELTPKTITDPQELLAGLDEIRSVGYAVDDEESLVGLRCIAVPLLGRDQRPIGAVSLEAPVSRLGTDDVIEEHARALQEAARSMESAVRDLGL